MVLSLICVFIAALLIGLSSMEVKGLSVRETILFRFVLNISAGIFFFTAGAATASAQTSYQDNRIYMSFQPGDLGVGMRLDHDNAYASLAFGNYWLPNGGYIHDHVKMTIGCIIEGYTIGISYHRYGDINATLPLNRMATSPISMEFGARIEIGKRNTVALRFDPFQWQGTVDFGWLFPP
jgi:hypothetical protein